jgi:putative Holliday junction resolvase
LGVDWGRRWIGLAIKPAGQDWPLPQATMTVTGEEQAIQALREAIARSQAQAVVVGLPVHPDPAQSRQIKRFSRKTRQGMTGVRWFFVDERLTSQAAESLSPRGAGRRPADDLAAALILETFLQTCR